MYRGVSLIIIFLVAPLCGPSLSQSNKSLEYPYGGVPDSTRPNFRNYRSPLSFTSKTIFRSVRFSGFAEFEEARFYKEAEFYNVQFDTTALFNRARFSSKTEFTNSLFLEQSTFSDAQFDSNANFSGARFNQGVWFKSAKFLDLVIFGRIVEGEPIAIAEFHGPASFAKARFCGATFFAGVSFHRGAEFSETHFCDEAYFSGVDFYGTTDFDYAQFDTVCNFSETNFNGVTFDGARFHKSVIFENTRFQGTVSFYRTQFENGVDLRKANFDQVRKIYLDGIRFPVGEFFLYWEQFRSKIGIPQGDSVEYSYGRTEIIYNQLRDNFLKQDDKASADAVMYELGQQREEIKKEFFWKIYGLILGYGYQPWRFLIIVGITALFFSLIWFIKYYGIVAIVLNEHDASKKVFQFLKSNQGIQLCRTIKIKDESFTFGATIFDHQGLSSYGIGYLPRIWHVIFFSFSVLLGIRWKKEWSDIKYTGIYGADTFLRVVTFEYLLGLSFYLTFALLVKGSRFDFIKGLLGF